MKLQALVRGHYVRKQGLETMRCMESLVRVQDRARSQRLIQMSQSKREEGEEMKRHIGSVDNNNIGKERWDLGRRSMEEHYVLRKSQEHQHDAAFIRLERGHHARAASIYHQQVYHSNFFYPPPARVMVISTFHEQSPMYFFGPNMAIGNIHLASRSPSDSWEIW